MICINNNLKKIPCPASPVTTCNFYEFSSGVGGTVGEPVYMCDIQVIMPPAVQLPRTGGMFDYFPAIFYFVLVAIFIAAIFTDILKDK